MNLSTVSTDVLTLNVCHSCTFSLQMYLGPLPALLQAIMLSM